MSAHMAKFHPFETSVAEENNEDMSDYAFDARMKLRHAIHGGNKQEIRYATDDLVNSVRSEFALERLVYREQLASMQKLFDDRRVPAEVRRVLETQISYQSETIQDCNFLICELRAQLKAALLK